MQKTVAALHTLQLGANALLLQDRDLWKESSDAASMELQRTRRERNHFMEETDRLKAQLKEGHVPMMNAINAMEGLRRERDEARLARGALEEELLATKAALEDMRKAARGEKEGCNDPSCGDNSCDCTHAFCPCKPVPEEKR